MKSRYIVILFLIAAATIYGAYYLTKNHPEKTENSVTRAKTVIPKIQNEENEISDEEIELTMSRSYIELQTDETLISSVFIDINNDTLEDEIDIVKLTDIEHFQIIPSIFNKETKKYDRLPKIQTEISRAGSVSLQGLDVIGDHVNAFIFQGTTDDNNSVLQIFQFFATSEDKQSGEVKLIGNFTSDVMVYVQQIDRSESYDFDATIPGESFPVFLYKIDPSDTSSNPGQLQQEFEWNEGKARYVLSKETKLPAGRIEAAELSKLQNGNVDVYGEFLNGLWAYGNGSSRRYIYFDYPNKEIIQIFPDLQGIFSWGQSRVRKNGIFISTVNTMITNLRRRIDVSLVNLNEIRLVIRDDVNMNIEQDNALDGYYTRQEVIDFVNLKAAPESLKKIIEELENGPAWVSSDSSTTIKFADNIYTLENLSGSETGLYSPVAAGLSDMIQIRSFAENPILKDSYKLSFGKKTEIRRGRERQVDDYDTVIFKPAKIYTNGAEETQNTEIILTRQIENNSETENQ